MRFNFYVAACAVLALTGSAIELSESEAAEYLAQVYYEDDFDYDLAQSYATPKTKGTDINKAVKALATPKKTTEVTPCKTTTAVADKVAATAAKTAQKTKEIAEKQAAS